MYMYINYWKSYLKTGEKIRLNAVFGNLINLSVSISTDSVLCSDDSKKTPRSNHEDRRFQDFVN